VPAGPCHWRWSSAAESAGPGSGCGAQTCRSLLGAALRWFGLVRVQRRFRSQSRQHRAYAFRQHNNGRAAATADLGLRWERGSATANRPRWARAFGSGGRAWSRLNPVRLRRSKVRATILGGHAGRNFGCVLAKLPLKNRLQNRRFLDRGRPAPRPEGVIGHSSERRACSQQAVQPRPGPMAVLRGRIRSMLSLQGGHGRRCVWGYSFFRHLLHRHPSPGAFPEQRTRVSRTSENERPLDISDLHGAKKKRRYETDQHRRGTDSARE